MKFSFCQTAFFAVVCASSWVIWQYHWSKFWLFGTMWVGLDHSQVRSLTGQLQSFYGKLIVSLVLFYSLLIWHFFETLTLTTAVFSFCQKWNIEFSLFFLNKWKCLKTGCGNQWITNPQSKRFGKNHGWPKFSVIIHFTKWYFLGEVFQNPESILANVLKQFCFCCISAVSLCPKNDLLYFTWVS